VEKDIKEIFSRSVDHFRNVSNPLLIWQSKSSNKAISNKLLTKRFVTFICF